MTAPTDNLVLAALRAFVDQRVEEALQTRQADGPRPEGFISTAEAARRAGATQDTILSWISKQILPATRPPKTTRWRIRPADLEALLAEGKGREPLRFEDHRAAAAARMAASVKPSRGAP